MWANGSARKQIRKKKKYISRKNLKKKNILEFLQKKGIFGVPDNSPPPRENKEFFVQGGGGGIINNFGDILSIPGKNVDDILVPQWPMQQKNIKKKKKSYLQNILIWILISF